MFVVGLTTAFVWCGAQAVRAFTTLQGVSLAQYIAFSLSFMIGFMLALEGRKKNPGRIITQQIFMFAAWSTCGTLLVLAVIVQGGYVWSKVDTTITTLASLGLITTLFWAFVSRKPLSDAAVRAFIGASLKPLPQFLLIVKIWSEGSAGLTITAVILGNISIWMRLIPLAMSMKTEGVNRDKIWLFVADSLNGLSWLTVSIVWFIK
jgi:hypothetical protein